MALNRQLPEASFLFVRHNKHQTLKTNVPPPKKPSFGFDFTFHCIWDAFLPCPYADVCTVILQEGYSHLLIWNFLLTGQRPSLLRLVAGLGILPASADVFLFRQDK
uniref:Uncharacterized protein n=1 Tax=Micrurus paraensis TaxID=1970185 RepID=A0A2D4KII7_9SAUR